MAGPSVTFILLTLLLEGEGAPEELSLLIPDGINPTVLPDFSLPCSSGYTGGREENSPSGPGGCCEIGSYGITVQSS